MLDSFHLAIFLPEETNRKQNISIIPNMKDMLSAFKKLQLIAFPKFGIVIFNGESNCHYIVKDMRP